MQSNQKRRLGQALALDFNKHEARSRELDLIRKGDGFLFLIFVFSVRGLTPEPLQKLWGGKRSGSQGRQN